MLNKIILMGRLTADPEIKQTQSGINTVSFSIACERDYAASGEKRQVDFINIVAWRQTAEVISKYFSKGRMIAIEGRLQTRDYTDANGNKHYLTEVVANRAYFADSKPDWQTKSDIKSQEQTAEYEEIDDDEDVPFL